ncbi:MAG: hypothetical protein ACHREM_26180 [Polyangiales bacterium]
MEHPARPPVLTRHVRTVLPSHVHERLRHLAVDLGLSLADLLAEGAILVCRYHQRGDGLPEPTAPVVATTREVSR